MKTFSNLLRSSASESAGMLRELLACQCDVGLVDRDGLPHRLVQIVPLVVSAYEVVKCRKRRAVPESLKDEGDLPTHLLCLWRS